jgi:integrase/recombinase XerD
VEEFLEYHRVTGSSPHTVRGYAKALQLWWRYLELDGRDWAGADVPALAGFVTWLRQGIPPGVVLLDPAAAAPPRLAESTLATRLAAVVSFYRYHHDAHGVAPALARPWSGPPRRSRYRAFLAHLDGRSRAPRRSPMPVRPRRREACPLLTPAQVAAVLSACAEADPRVIFQVPEGWSSRAPARAGAKPMPSMTVRRCASHNPPGSVIS